MRNLNVCIVCRHRMGQAKQMKERETGRDVGRDTGFGEGASGKKQWVGRSPHALDAVVACRLSCIVRVSKVARQAGRHHFSFTQRVLYETSPRFRAKWYATCFIKYQQGIQLY